MTAAVSSGWSEAAIRVLNERYALKDKNGNPTESPDDIMERVAWAVAAAEHRFRREWADKFADLMKSRKFMPNSPTLMNAGKGNGLQLSACYVVPVPDSIPGIFEAVKHAAIIHQSGGGTGFSFSRLRSAGSRVNTTGGVASGPVSFMRVFDAATDAIKQGGTRRGANMGILRVDHPDILEFIDCKRSGGITNFNISVAITDDFMNALRQNDEYDLYEPGTKARAFRLKAWDVWSAIISAAWATGDPGLVFIDRANASSANPMRGSETLEATNPCGEQWLGPYDACNLGSINLSEFIGTKPERLEWQELAHAVETAVRFLDDVIDINPYPLPEVKKKVHANRRIGLGVMGWADLLYKMNIEYGSAASLALAEDVGAFIRVTADEASQKLAEERGPFPNFDHSIYRDSSPIRNATRTTVAPTGTISIIAGCSSGIEPVFSLAYQHKVHHSDGTSRVLDIVNPIFEQAIHNHESEEAIRAIVRVHGSLSRDDLEHYGLGQFVTAHQVAPLDHIRMQAEWQKNVDNSISKTINMPESSSVEEVGQAYLDAYSMGCLGITVYRDGCKGVQVLNAGVNADETRGETSANISSDRDSADAVGAFEADTEVVRDVFGHAVHDVGSSTGVDNAPEEVKPNPALEFIEGLKVRPRILDGYTHQIRSPQGTVHVTLNSDDAGLLETYITVGKAGSDVEAMSEALGRIMSLYLRTQSEQTQEQKVVYLREQLMGIGGSSSVGYGPSRVRSIPDAVGQVLAEYWVNNYTPTPEGNDIWEEDDLQVWGEDTRGAYAYDTKLDPGEFYMSVGDRTSSPEASPALSTTSTPAKPRVGYNGADICKSCGNVSFVYVEGCAKCLICGISEC